MIKTISALSKYKNEATKTKATDKLSIKSIILPDVYESDDSTINFTKRIGGEVIQCYSLSEVKQKQPNTCVPSFKEIIFKPCRASSVTTEVFCEPSVLSFSTVKILDYDISFTTRNTTVIPEYDYETGTYIPGEFPTTPLTLSLTLKDIEGFWSLKRNNELLYSSEQMPPLDTNREIYEGGDFDYDIKFSLDIGEGSVGAVNIYEFKGKVSELGILTRNNAVATGELEITRYDSINIPKYKFTTINVDLILPDYFPNHITTAKHMFFNSSIKDSSLSSWDVSNVMNMSGMFSGVNFKNNVDLSSWVTTKVKDMSYMFEGAFNFNKDISGWDVSNVTNMEYMFSSAVAFNQDLSQWCVSNITTKPTGFDSNATSWTLPKPEWGTCPSDEDGLVFSVQDINSNGTEFEVWANRADKPTNPTWYLKNLTADTIVASADGFVADGYTVADSGYILNITIPLTPNVTRYAFTEVATYAGFGYYSDNDHTEDYPPKPDYIGLLPEINLTVESFSTTMDNIEFYCDYANITVPEYLPPNMTNLDYMFDSCYLFNQDISMWDVSNVTTMVQTFYGTSLFNQDLSTWDVSNVTDMYRMFSSAISFNQDLSDWDVSNVTSMIDMFCDATSFNGDVSTWDTSNVVGMYNMFDGASVFNQDVSSWDTSSVINMYRMFRNANAFNSDISNWDTSKVTEMARMFDNATTFNQDLSQWCVSNITTKPDDFDRSATAWTLSRPVWGTCPERLPTSS